jgi:hypothetical protein
MREGIKETSEHAQFGSYILQGAGDMVGSGLRRRRSPPKSSIERVHDLALLGIIFGRALK